MPTYIARVTTTLKEATVDLSTIRKSLEKRLNPKKALDPYGVSPRDLTIMENSIDQGLFNVSKQRVDFGKYPTSWKLSCLNLAFKGGNTIDRGNFRPISLLSVPGKILEDTVSPSIDQHMILHSLSSPKQWGFKQGHSTEGLLLHMTEIWRKALDQDIKVGVILIDFRKAFDTLNHKILIQKMKGIGLNTSILSRFEDYLNGRKQYTKGNGKCSGERLMKCGVTQGSILGPRLISVYLMISLTV